MIRDKIVFSTENPALKERLLRDPKLSLGKAVDTTRSSEFTHKELVGTKGAEESDEQEVDVLVTTLTIKPEFQEAANSPGLESHAVAVDDLEGDAEPLTCETNAQLGESLA